MSSYIEPLFVRRKISNISFLYKIIHGQVDNPEFLEQVQFNIPRFGARQSPIFKFDIPHTNQHMNSPLISMSRQYNEVQNFVDIFCDNYTHTFIVYSKMLF